jgi:hypothetical protein
LPVDKVSADAAKVPNLVIVLAGGKERSRVGDGTVKADDTNFVFVDQPIGYAKVRPTVRTVS